MIGLTVAICIQHVSAITLTCKSVDVSFSPTCVTSYACLLYLFSSFPPSWLQQGKDSEILTEYFKVCWSILEYQYISVLGMVIIVVILSSQSVMPKRMKLVVLNTFLEDAGLGKL